ncbi:putative secreted salivary gland peptide [Ixodes scapularis]
MRYALVVAVVVSVGLVWPECGSTSRVKKAKMGRRLRSTDTATFPVVEFSEVEAVRSHNKTGVVIDVREPEELETDGRIPNFHNIPLKSIPEAFELEPKEFETKYNFSKPEADDVIIFSCRSGRRALLAAQRLDKLQKYRNIKVYEGSFQNWLKCGGVIIINGRPV